MAIKNTLYLVALLITAPMFIDAMQGGSSSSNSGQTSEGALTDLISTPDSTNPVADNTSSQNGK